MWTAYTGWLLQEIARIRTSQVLSSLLVAVSSGSFVLSVFR
jgi:hypothetical protein